MLKNYLKTAWRNLSKQKGLTFINIFGLSAGLACFILFLLFAINEFSFDRFHKNGKNIYRVYLWFEAKGEEKAGAISHHPMALGPAIKRDLQDVQESVRMRDGWGESFIKANGQMNRMDVSYADPAFFSMFSFKLKSGNPATVLNDLHSLVLTEETATKLFGKTDPLGKIIQIKTEDDFEPFTVTGIAENIPSNSTIQFKMLANFKYLETTRQGQKRLNNWHQLSYQTYVQLKTGSNLNKARDRWIAFRKKYLPEEEENSRKDGWNGKGPRVYFGLQPIRDIHTNTLIGGALVKSVDPKTIWILLAIAGGVLLIACINFTTLAIGRSAGRAKEVGVRKVIGGSRKSLVFQFLSEAFLLTFFSALFGIILADMLLPLFNELSGSHLSFSFVRYPELAAFLIGLVILVGLLAGIYPAVILSGFRPVEILKTKIRLGGSNFFTKSLVTLQFVVSAGLIISTIIILQQIHYMQAKYPGYDKENVVVVNASGISKTKQLYNLFRQELSNKPEILATASAELGLGADQGWSQSAFDYKGKKKEMYEYFVDADYIHLMRMQLIGGRNFDPHISSDTINSVIINEALMRDFGWTYDNAVGQKIKGYYDDENDPKTPIVIGIVKDFNFFSYGSKISPQIFQQFSNYEPFKFYVRIGPGDPSKALAILQSAWKKIAPDYPLKYNFLDETLDQFYKSEARWSNIVGWAGGISVFLACLGLLGLASLAVANRAKEIGIRKVLGANLLSIVRLLSNDFLKLVLIAFLIAIPIAWVLMKNWLQDYSYRIQMRWWVFALTAGLVIFLALVTVSFQALRAALTKPVNSLRSE
ncbi:MAG: ABC transporter permease [Chitinophagales bacterium]